jgi:HPt (histidine-containing phosphotransfer) domain-containing protein
VSGAPLAALLPPLALDVDGALARLGGNMDLYGNILKSFLTEFAGTSDQLARLLHEDKLTDARNLLHTLKGTAATVGSQQLAGVAAQAEAALENSDRLPNAEHLLADIAAAMARARTAMQKVVRQLVPGATAAPPSGSAGPLGPAESARLKETLQHLAGLLASSDMGALEVHSGLKQRYGQTFKSAADPLENAMAALDFAQARAHCMTLIQQLAD